MKIQIVCMDSYINHRNLKGKMEGSFKKVENLNIHKMDFHFDKTALLNLLRGKKRPVILTCHTHQPDRIDARIMRWWWEWIVEKVKK